MVDFGSSRKNGIALLILSACGSLTACGGSDGTAASGPVAGATGSESLASTASTTGASTRVAALSVAGSPGNTVRAGVPYSFIPVVEPAGSATSFSITNKPAWASFSAVTGELSGTPGSTDTGLFAGIVITANSVTESAALAAFSIDVTQQQQNGTATLSWIPPTQYTDGTSLGNLGGYNIYVGSSADALTNKIQLTNPGLTAYTVGGLGAGTHFFGITAYSSAGTESDLTVVGSKTIM